MLLRSRHHHQSVCHTQGRSLVTNPCCWTLYEGSGTEERLEMELDLRVGAKEQLSSGLDNGSDLYVEG